jgi:hypothetical protein
MSEPFHAVAFMRRRREEIDSEDAGLTWEEKRIKTRDVLHGDPLWECVKDRVLPAGTSVDPPVDADTPRTARRKSNCR